MNSSERSPVPDVTVTAPSSRRDTILAEEQDARTTWDLAVASVPASAIAEPRLPGGRSVKDTVAHMAAWERWAEERIVARLQGRAPLATLDWHAFEHDFNQRVDARSRAETWEAVAREAAEAYAAYRARVEELDEEGIGKAEELIRACGSRHYAEYLGQIRDLVDGLPLHTSFESERLALRSLRPSDAPALHALFTDPEVMRYIPPSPPLTIERLRRGIDRRIGLERTTGLTLWAVVLGETGELIGQCGFALVEGTGPAIEIAYHYVRSAWGHGYATEAAVACLERGFGALGLEQVIAICFPENVASWRVMEKAGMTFDGEGEYYGIHMKRYVADRATWRRPALTSS